MSHYFLKGHSFDSVKEIPPAEAEPLSRFLCATDFILICITFDRQELALLLTIYYSDTREKYEKIVIDSMYLSDQLCMQSSWRNNETSKHALEMQELSSPRIEGYSLCSLYREYSLQAR